MEISKHSLIKRYLVTERSNNLRAQNKYVFVVDPRANKIQVKEAVQSLFNVKVANVHTAIMPSKMRRRMYGRTGQTSEWKKAIVTLEKGQEIKELEKTS